MARRPDHEAALRIGANELFLAGLRGEKVFAVDSYTSTRGNAQRVDIATKRRPGIVIFAWRTT